MDINDKVALEIGRAILSKVIAEDKLDQIVEKLDSEKEQKESLENKDFQV